jgi:hypothetical protein
MSTNPPFDWPLFGRKQLQRRAQNLATGRRLDTKPAPLVFSGKVFPGI